MATIVRGAAASLAVLLTAGLGYLWADAADVVPGVVTTRPLPPQRHAVAPTVAAPEAPEPSLAAAAAPAPVDPAALAARLDPLLADPALGPGASASLRDLTTGEAVYARQETSPRVPASTAKVLTSAVALQTLGATTTLATATSWLTAAERGADRPAVVLTGGGDVLLGAGHGDPAAVVGRAGLADLAEGTARALLAAEEPLLQPATGAGPALDVVVDDSLLGADQQLARGAGDTRWSASPASLAVEAGVLGDGPRDTDPAATAGRAFGAALQQALARLRPDGTPLVGDVTVTSAGPPPAGLPLAEVRSAPLQDVLAHLLATSDNTTADAVAGLVAAEVGRPTSLVSAGQVVAELATASAGLAPGQVTLADGSGLSAGSTVSADALTRVLATAAAAPDGDPLRLLPELLPVAGLDGTVSDRFGAAGGAAAARGVARSKTGTLTGVTTLAGVGTTADGRGVAYALMADAVPATGTLAARDAVDRALAAVASCC